MGRTTIKAPWPTREELRAVTDRLSKLEGREREPKREFPPSGTLEVLTLSALVIYGAVRFADAAFYARLGVSPDDVGLDYARTLGKVAAGVLLLLASVVLLAWSGWFASGSKPVRVRIPAWFLAGSTGVTLLGALLPPTPRWLLMLIAGAIGVLGALLRDLYNEGRLHRWPRPGRAALALIAAVAIVVVFGLSGLIGYRAAEYVRDGKPLPCGCSKLFGHNVALPWVSASKGFLGVEADEVDVTWVTKSDRPSEPLPKHPIYLGTADGLVALYDADRDMVVRIPATEIAIGVEAKPLTWSEASN